MRKLITLFIIGTIGVSTWGQNKIESTGDVGIGTTEPDALLHIFHDSSKPSKSNGLHVGNNLYGISIFNGSTGNYFPCISGRGNNNLSGILLKGELEPTATNFPALLFRGSNAGYTTKIGNSQKLLEIQNYTTELFTLLGNGNLGIGTTDPSTKLDVKGEIKCGNSGNASIELATHYWSGSHGILFNAYKKIKGDGGISSNTSFSNDVGGYSGGAGSIFFYGNGGTMDFCISPNSTGKNSPVEWGDPKLRIFRNGNIAIGKLTANHQLDVAGTIRAEEILVEAQTADFVFEPDYQLKPLSEVESFINTNKHLPEIPSATQMEEQGVNLAEMNKLLLQKVEELTLYSINLEKRDQEMKLMLDRKNEEIKAVRSEMEERFAKIEELLKNKTL